MYFRYVDDMLVAFTEAEKQLSRFLKFLHVNIDFTIELEKKELMSIFKEKQTNALFRTIANTSHINNNRKVKLAAFHFIINIS